MLYSLRSQGTSATRGPLPPFLVPPKCTHLLLTHIIRSKTTFEICVHDRGHGFPPGVASTRCDIKNRTHEWGSDHSVITLICSRDRQDKWVSTFWFGNIYILYRSFIGSVAKMRCSTALALLFGITVAALRSPHERARNAVPERPKPKHLHDRSNPLRVRHRPAYLNSKTLSMTLPGKAQVHHHQTLY